MIFREARRSFEYVAGECFREYTVFLCLASLDEEFASHGVDACSMVEKCRQKCVAHGAIGMRRLLVKWASREVPERRNRPSEEIINDQTSYMYIFISFLNMEL